MPIYEFTCLDCSEDSEILVRSSDWKKEASCPTCGSPKLDKKLSVFSSLVRVAIPRVSSSVLVSRVIVDVARWIIRVYCTLCFPQTDGSLANFRAYRYPLRCGQLFCFLFGLGGLSRHYKVSWKSMPET